jgi:hypothetical protein
LRVGDDVVFVNKTVHFLSATHFNLETK